MSGWARHHLWFYTTVCMTSPKNCHTLNESSQDDTCAEWMMPQLNKEKDNENVNFVGYGTSVHKNFDSNNWVVRSPRFIFSRCYQKDWCWLRMEFSFCCGQRKLTISSSILQILLVNLHKASSILIFWNNMSGSENVRSTCRHQYHGVTDCTAQYSFVGNWLSKINRCVHA